MNYKVKLVYDPYHMESRVIVDDRSIDADEHFRKLQDLIKAKTPMQTWLWEIPFEDYAWPGLLNAIARDKHDNGTVTVEFTGRKIDFEDLRNAMNYQNAQRSPSARLALEFQHHLQFEENTIRESADYVVKELIKHQAEFLQDRKEEQLIAAYKSLEENYEAARNKEFQIVCSGVVSAGKSTLINALIRRRLLSVAENTCTNIVTEIHHADGLDGVKVQCYEDKAGKKEIGTGRAFTDDWACAAYLNEIRLSNQTQSAALIKISMDLSHLYPKSMNSKDFCVVIVDTPGFESSETEMLRGDTVVNRHEQIALDAINDETKPMVIFCTRNPDEKALQNVMTEIAAESKDTNGGFNDRFLFIYSQCDRKHYGNETLEDFVSNYAEKLTAFAKISQNEQIKNTANFVPRIFPVAALPSLVTRYKNILDQTGTDNDEKLDLWLDYSNFQRRIALKKKNYFLTNYCSIPQPEKDALAAAFEKAVEEGAEADAVHLQSGIPAIEIAIQDYIERYAYPIKIRALLETFELILPDLKNKNESNKKNLQDAIDGLKNGEASAKEVAIKQEELAKEQDRIRNVQKRAESKKNELAAIQFDRSALDEAMRNFQAEFYSSSVIEEFEVIIREKRGIIKCQGTEETIRKKCNEYRESVIAAYQSAVAGSQSYCEEFVCKQREALTKILNGLNEIRDEIGKNGSFCVGGADFTQSLAWNTFIQFTVNERELQRKMLETVKHSVTTHERMVPNPKKLEKTRNPFKIIAKWFMAKEILQTYEVHEGSYSIWPLWEEVQSITAALAKEIDEIEKEYKANLKIMREGAQNLTEKIVASINAYAEEADLQKRRIREIGKDNAAAEKEMRRIEAQQELLEILIEKMPQLRLKEGT